MRSRRIPSPAFLAGLVVVWSVAWSAPLGLISWDTKYDLLVDPWRLMGRALHLWDPQVTWGGLSNQGYGYLFPMGPFFALLSEVFPMWVVQRLWWMFLLTLGFVGAVGALRALGVGTPASRVIGGLAWVLAPRVVSAIGVLSSEAQPQLLAPLILWPVVLGWRGRLTPLRASALSGLAILLCGGVNASATLLAAVPAGLFLISRPTWWRERLFWGWLTAVVLGTAWWLGPLLLMGRFSPPFLDWIESAEAVSAPITLLDVLRGTTHWVGHLVTAGGPWWPAGYELATRPLLIVTTATVAALGVAGLGLRSLPFRGYAWLSFIIGVVALSLPHVGPFASPVLEPTLSALDGVLAPFRNIHKIDPLVRLPVIIGLVHLLGVLQHAKALRLGRSQLPWRGSVAVAACAVLVVVSAAPGFTGVMIARGAHQDPASYWVDLGQWLEREAADGSAVVVPAASFGEYFWGRTIDEPLRSLTNAPYAVRDAVPLAPAGATRLLDELELRLQSGRSMGAAAEVLRRAGVRHLVLRNDLDTGQSGQPSVALARSAIVATPGVSFVQGFGGLFHNSAGHLVSPVEVYRLDGDVAGEFTVHPAEDVLQANGASDDVFTIADAGMGSRPVIFDGDSAGRQIGGTRVLTDGLRARDRFFGAPRGEDASATLSVETVEGTRDYRPWAAESLMSTTSLDGISTITASSSLAHNHTFAGLAPAMRPAAALDGDPDTGWLTMWDHAPTLTINLAHPRTLDHVILTPFTRTTDVPGSLAVASRVTVTTDSGTVEAELGDGPTRVPLEPTPTGTVSIRIDQTRVGDPGDSITGLAEVVIPGVVTGEVLDLPDTAEEPVSAIVLDSGLPGRDGCVVDVLRARCAGDQAILPETTGTAAFRIPSTTAAEWQLSGTLRTLRPVGDLYGSADVTVTASSTRSPAPAAAPASVVDGDPRTAWSPQFGDHHPRLTFTFAGNRTVENLHFDARDLWLASVRPMLRIQAGPHDLTLRMPADGKVTIPATTLRELTVSFHGVPGERTPLFFGMELAEVSFPGVTLASAVERVFADCGRGPSVHVNGASVPTRVSATRDGWLGLTETRWQACEDVPLTGSDDVISVGAWSGMAPARTVLMRDPDVLTSGRATTTEGRWVGPNQAALAVEAEPYARVLSLTQNESAGWRAQLDGAALEPVVVDGHRQGFIVPAGAQGSIEIDFAADGQYRWSLLVGLILAFLLVPAAVLSGPSRSAGKHQASGNIGFSRHSQWLTWFATIAVAGLVAGPAGGLAALTGLVVAARLSVRWRVLAVVASIVATAVAAAVLGPGSAGPTWLEGTIRLVLIAALAVAAATQTRGQARGGQLDELVAEETQEQADRHADS